MEAPPGELDEEYGHDDAQPHRGSELGAHARSTPAAPCTVASQRIIVVVALRHLRVRLGLRTRTWAGLVGVCVKAEEVVHDLRDDR